MKRMWSHSPGVAVVLLIFGVMLLGIMGVAISWEVYNTQVSGVDVVEMQQVYALAQSGIEFAIGYANDTVNNPDRHRALQSPGLIRTFAPSGSFPGGSFTVLYNPLTNILTSTAALTGSTARRELALMNFRNYVAPDWSEDFDEPPDQSFDQRYFASTKGWGDDTVVLSNIDDQTEPWLEQAFTMAGETVPDIGAHGGFFNIGFPLDIFIPGEQEYIMIFPTTPGTGRLKIQGQERSGLPVEQDGQNYQNYSIEVKFSLNVLIPQLDQGFGIIFRLHHPTKALGGPWNETDLDETLAYVLQMEPRIGAFSNGQFLIRWLTQGPDGHRTFEGSCGGDELFFNELYCKEQEPNPAGLVDVYKGGYFIPEKPVDTACPPIEPGWGWTEDNWIDCNTSDTLSDVHKLRIDVVKDRFTVYFGTKHGVHCDDTGSFVMHKIMEIDVGEERVRRGSCVPNYRAGHIGLRVWNGFQAQVDYIKVWAM